MDLVNLIMMSISMYGETGPAFFPIVDKISGEEMWNLARIPFAVPAVVNTPSVELNIARRYIAIRSL
jgi:hypothetical protein